MDAIMPGGRSIPEAEARRAHKVLKAVWMIVSAQHEDAVAADVARLGEPLRAAIEAGDWKAAAEAVDAVHAWMLTMAGVVTSRMTRVFER
jgi:hypothetical protein